MQEHCNIKGTPLCTCQNWSSELGALQIDHLIGNYHFLRFYLIYRTLDPGEDGRRLCAVGECRKCCGRLCYGTDLPADLSVDALLGHIYRWSYQVWHNQMLPPFNEVESFRAAFRVLFHVSDLPVVKEWLKRPENQHDALLRSNCGTEV